MTFVKTLFLPTMYQSNYQLNMKKQLFFLMAIASVMITSCQSKTNEQPTTEQVVVDNIMARRSVRQYKQEPVKREQMETIVKCGINAPNAMNKQAWEVRVLDNKADIDSISKIYLAANPRYAAESTFRNMFRNAPTVAFLAAPANPNFMEVINIGLMAENMMLAAQSMGIGTCCLGGPVYFLNDNPDAKFFINKLNFSADYQLVLVLAFGYPDENPGAKPRDESKVIFID